jgi:hypothetical protein
VAAGDTFEEAYDAAVEIVQILLQQMEAGAGSSGAAIGEQDLKCGTSVAHQSRASQIPVGAWLARDAF